MSSNSTLIQLIDEHDQFTKTASEYFEKNIKTDHYCVVSIMGSQSTGKSTLLNLLFNTNFDEMNTQKRQQTTRGIWTSITPSDSSRISENNLDFVIMDVEGCDGIERKDDQRFEKLSATFSLSITNVLIINMWENQVGLYNGANISLLKTIFEVNIDLTLSSLKSSDSEVTTKNKKIILIVVRDFTGQTPLENLASTISKELNNVFENIKKSSENHNLKLENMFEFRYYGLSHKLLMPDKFNSETRELKNMFVDSSHNSYMFKNINIEKNVHKSLLHNYLNNIWTIIKNNKALDIPNQQELVTAFKCDEIIDIIMDELPKLKDKGEYVNKISTLIGTLDSNINRTVIKFSKLTTRLNSKITEQKEKKLVDLLRRYAYENIGQNLKFVFKSDLDLLHDTIKNNDQKDIQAFLELQKKCDIILSNWENKITEIRNVDNFKDFDFVEIDKKLSDDINDLLESEKINTKNHEMKVYTNLIFERISKIINKTNFSADYFNIVINEFVEITQEKLELYGKQILKLQINKYEKEFHQVSKQKLLKELKLFFNNETILLAKIKYTFDMIFKYKNNIPRLFSNDEQIENSYTEAKTKTLEILNVLKSLSNDQFDTKVEMIDLNLFDNTVKSLTNYMELQCVDTKRATLSNTSKIPRWIIILLLIVGWNEIIAIVSNPLYIVLTCIFASTGAILYKLDMLYPFIFVTKKIAYETLDKVKYVLNEKDGQRAHVLTEKTIKKKTQDSKNHGS